MKMTNAPVFQDVRDIFLASVITEQNTADIVADGSGVISGTKSLIEALQGIGIQPDFITLDGSEVLKGTVIATISGSPKQIAMAEEFSIGVLAKPSGIATAARRAVALAGPDLRIVCGAWKKMPPAIKHTVREAITCGGAAFRISDKPFVYLDKNIVSMLHGIEATLAVVRDMKESLKCIQIKGWQREVAEEAILAATNGADIIMVDTGRVEDIQKVNEALMEKGLRSQVRLAFAKGIRIEDIPELTQCGIDILDIGCAILDAPLLDMRLDVRRGGIEWN